MKGLFSNSVNTFHSDPNRLDISELCILGFSWAILRRWPLDQTMKAFMGLLICSPALLFGPPFGPISLKNRQSTEITSSSTDYYSWCCSSRGGFSGNLTLARLDGAASSFSRLNSFAPPKEKKTFALTIRRVVRYAIIALFSSLDCKHDKLWMILVGKKY